MKVIIILINITLVDNDYYNYDRNSNLIVTWIVSKIYSDCIE